jgi:hypothetical protein
VFEVGGGPPRDRVIGRGHPRDRRTGSGLEGAPAYNVGRAYGFAQAHGRRGEPPAAHEQRSIGTLAQEEACTARYLAIERG